MLNIEDKISLSTCCCSNSFHNGYQMLEYIANLGFKNVELSHGIRTEHIPGILEAVEDKIINVTSVHNFCPLPPGINFSSPNLFKPSSSNKLEVKLWSKYTKSTIDLAKRVNANSIVIHLGSVWFFFKSPKLILNELIQTKKLPIQKIIFDKEFLKVRDATMNRIKRSSKKEYRNLYTNIISLLDFILDSNIVVAIENREGFDELPLDGDYKSFISSLGDNSNFRYWHDVGHAEIKSQYGLLDHIPHLKEIREYLVGFHFHDVSTSGVDHQEIGTGIVDFEKILDFYNIESHSIVLELSPKLSEKSILNSRDYIINLYNSRK